MHRVDTPGSVEGLFQDGNPAIGQQATQLLAAWFNDVQENLAQLIEYAGIELEKGNYDQLRDAVIQLIAGVVGDGSGAVPTTRTVTGAGLLAGQGGALAADLVFTLLAASSADVTAGTDNTKAITPAALAGSFAATFGTNGYWKAPGGLIIQWGQLRGTYSEGSVAVAFPTAFAEACYVALVTANNQAANNDRDVHCQNVSRSLTGATFYFNYDGSGSNLIQGLDYLVIGK